MPFTKRMVIFFIACSAMVSCIPDEFPTKGVLIGYDARLCACCGGMFVNLNNVDTMNVNTKLAGTLPTNFVFSPDELPLKVQFAWESGGGCLDNNIVILRIKRR